MIPDRFQPTFGQPNVFNPMESGPAIEDFWPSLYIGAGRVEEMRRKIRELAWATAAYERWQAEALTVLSERPVFARRPDGGRTGNAGRTRIFSDAGHHLAFDPARRSPMWDPETKEYMEPHPGADGAWMVHQHERLRRLMSSLAFLWRLTGDRRFANWAWEGMRDLAALYEETAAVHDAKAEPYRFVYGGLYEAQCQLQVVQTLELLADAPGGESETARVRDRVITPACEAIARWMDVMIVHNMSVWSMAALGEAGRLLGRDEWLHKALHSERCGLTVLLDRGLRRNAATGKPDGFWFEHSPFYACFYVVTPIITLVRAGEKAGVMTDDLRERFASFFDAPPLLADSELRLLSLSDRVAPGSMRLTQMRHLYEYAAGQVDARHGALLALLYERCGAPRCGLAAVAFGPDQLPTPEAPASLRHSGALPEASVATFRAETPGGGATLWFTNLKRYPGSAQGHHHMDKLSISLHAFGAVVTSDLGWPGSESDESLRGAYLSGTLSHNTLLLSEHDQGTVQTVSFHVDAAAPIPWARGSFRGDSKDSMWKTFLGHHGGRLEEGLYDDALISRTVWFDFPRVILLDELDAGSDKRFGFAFHARGLMAARGEAGADAVALGMPALPEDGAWSCFRGRAHADPVSLFTADWRVRSDIYLRLVTLSDGTFDAFWGSTPDNPAEICRGSVYVRAPGRKRRFATVLEVHSGTPQVAEVEIGENGAVTTRDFEGSERRYRHGE